MHHRHAAGVLAGLVHLACSAAPAIADVVELTPVRDTTIYAESSGLANGSGDHFFAGNPGGGTPRRALLVFDVASAIPPGSTISDVSLRLYMSRSSAAARDVAMHRLEASWGEGASHAGGQEGGGGPAAPGDATWAHRFFDTVAWTTPGGDFAPAASAVITVNDLGYYTWDSTPALIADLETWADDPAANVGWILLGDETIVPSAKRFDSRTNASVSRRPRLIVTFTPPPFTGACCQPDGVCIQTTDPACTTRGGIYQGDGVSCTGGLCPVPEGACCLPDGSCVIRTPVSCSESFGVYRGDDVPCTPDLCPPPTGGCCSPDTACVELTEKECDATGGVYQGHGSTCAPNPCRLEAFVDPLPLPPVAKPITGKAGGAAAYEIAIREMTQTLHRDLPPTRLWGYDGMYPGPTIEARRGEPVTVRWMNDLRDASGTLRTEHLLPVDLCPHGPDHEGNNPRTVVHLHGGHVPADSDGYPEDTILPGADQLFEYPNEQDAATLWYHDHALGITRLNVYLGLAGFYLMRDDDEDALGLPAGEFEIPLVIQDRTFNPDGSLVYPAAWQEHFVGNTILVNGVVWPRLEVKRGKYRFRIVNGSNGRTFTLSLSSGAIMRQIGSDGGLLEFPLPVGEITLAPAERADVVIDFAGAGAGSTIRLVNSAPAPFPGEPGVGVVPDVMQFAVTAETGFTDALPVELRDITQLEEAEAVASREFIMTRAPEPCAGAQWLINGLAWDDITEYPELGTTEIWRFVNRSQAMHPMHMHLVFFQVLDRQPFEVVDGVIVPTGTPVPPPLSEAGWKDTVRTNPSEITRVIARFEDYLGKFAYHCHVLEHEDHEMMRQFQTVPPCPADLDDDGTVGFTDLIRVIATWGPCLGPCAADLDGDMVVGFTDLLTVLAAWGACF